MRAQCIAAVTKAIGRKLTQAEVQDIEERIKRTMRQMAAKDPNWSSYSKADRLTLSAQEAAKALIAEKQLKQQRQALTILAHARIDGHLKAQAARGVKGLDALNRIIGFFSDGKSMGTSVEYQARAIAADSLRQMIATLEASHPTWFGLYENREGVEAIVKELFHENSGNADARQGAKLFQQVAEGLRQRFNRAGGDVGQLDDWGLPHHHSQARVAKAGRDTWKQDILPMLDRRRYVNEDGTPMNTAQLSDFLDHAWETIATGGANKSTPGQFSGTGARANRGNESRQIHFRNADSYIRYQDKYGERSLYEVLVGHIEGVSKDVAMTEGFGPNPDHTFGFFRDQILKDEKLADPTKSGKLDEQAIRTKSLYNEIAGKRLPVASEHLANAFDTLRSWLIAARLGSAVITSFSDSATLHLTGRVNQLPAMQLLANELHSLNRFDKTEERMANRAGLALNSMIASLNRFGQGTLGSNWSRKLANATLRASGLNAMTEARRRAFGTTMMGAIGAITKSARSLASLDPHDYRILHSKGITDTEFKVWKAAQLEDWGHGNNTMLTPDAIYRVPDSLLAPLGDPAKLREQAATRLLATVLEETDVAVIEPGARERTITGGLTQRGTWKGELTRSFFLFKSFPMAMLMRHWERGMSMPNTGGKVGYLATLLAATTVAGMASLQVSELLAGRDPRNMNPIAKGGARNWIAAMLKGGSLGIYGDFLFSDATQHGGSPLATLEGPVLGEVEDMFNLTQGNIMKTMQGKPTHTGADLVKMVKGNLPGASLWYAKGALDHLIFQRLQEYFSPGYLSSMRARARQQFGQTYWWDPGDPTPDRAPDLSAAVQN